MIVFILGVIVGLLLASPRVISSGGGYRPRKCGKPSNPPQGGSAVP